MIAVAVLLRAVGLVMMSRAFVQEFLMLVLR